MDRTKVSIDLGNWTVEGGRALPKAITSVNLSPLKHVFGSGVTEQLDRAKGEGIYLGSNLSKSKGMER